MQWVWRHCRQATWGPSARWQTQRATEGCSVYMFLMFLYLDIIFSSFEKKFPCWIPRGSNLKTAHLGMRTPGHTPALSGIDPDSLLQPSVQHREVRQEVSKLANGQKFQNVENEEKMKWHFWEVFYTFTTYICSLVWEFNKSLAIYYRIFCCSAIWKQQLLKVQNLTKT